MIVLILKIVFFIFIICLVVMCWENNNIDMEFCLLDILFMNYIRYRKFVKVFLKMVLVGVNLFILFFKDLDMKL